MTEDPFLNEFIEEFNAVIQKYKEKGNPKFRGVIGTITIVSDNNKNMGYPFINTRKTPRNDLLKAFNTWLEAGNALMEKINSLTQIPLPNEGESNISSHF